MVKATGLGVLIVLMIFFIVLSCLPKPSDGAKILLLPIAAGSHMLNFQQIAEALAVKGHVLHAVVNQDCKAVKKLSKSGVIIHGYKVTAGCMDESHVLAKHKMDMVLKGFSLTNLMSMMGTARQFIKDEQDPMFADKMFFTLKNENFDIAIVDAIIISRAMYILPYRLGIPTISVAAVSNLIATGVPALPSFTPIMREGKFSNQMSFIERVQNTMMILFLDRLTTYLFGHNELLADYAPELPYRSLDDIQADSALWLIMNELSIDYPQVSMPHVINIGGINTGPPKPLKGEFQQIADAATKGIVIVSFGSSISDFPQGVTDRLYHDLKQVKETVIWRYTGKRFSDTPRNMHLVDWMPQNDLLAHPNTKVFVTHCGCNGQFETLYHAIPMVGLPIFGDQKYNAIRMAKKNMGISLDLLNFKPGELASAINEVLHNDSYAKVMSKYSAIFRSQPMKPIDRAVYWIEHVLTYGHEHLRSPAIDMPWYSYWCIDVIIFVSSIILIISALVLLVLYSAIKGCYRCFSSGGHVKSKNKQKVQ